MIHAMRVKTAHTIRKVHDLFDRGEYDFPHWWERHHHSYHMRWHAS